MAPELEEVREWLLAQGYPLEMRVARCFQDADYRVFQSQYYLDEESKKMREIDVIARLEYPGEAEDKSICVTLVIECKVAPKPWVIFLGDQDAYPLSMFNALANHAGRDLLSNQKEFTDLPANGLICGPACVAYAAVALKGQQNEQDQAYRAYSTVAKAAKDYSRKEPLYGGDWATITVPIIVIDGSLFAAHLDDSGNLEVYAIDRTRLVLKNQSTGLSSSIVDVLTYSYLPGFVQSVREEVQGIVASCKANPKLLTEPGIPYRRDW